MRTTVIAGVIIALTAGHALAQGVAGQPTLAKPPAAKPPDCRRQAAAAGEKRGDA